MSSKTRFEPRDPDYRDKVAKSFALQTVMNTMGINLNSVRAGEVELSMDHRDAYTQQHGFIHAGVTATALDSACAYAAFSLMAPEAAVLTVEFKTTLITPADGERFIYRGRVLKPGKTLTYTEGSAWAVQGDQETLVATMTATIMALYGRSHLRL
ncbi:PaaI family thioesterase [Hoeflea prorocentri]|uniref:PaaI family thioesterase n=1 Tax=Hoeflea prorocentri TaxID=1922333 RepID=A0A9X3ZK22_9HYPH|nr:PaaI family thioesterase [Hoeflea prorocentri]MCY6383698.1 PaaI family thioesterase [Hoeflea prorocentri]MDA5401498.1 PaaI family thioesterase [Hoeflea prorocentri]